MTFILITIIRFYRFAVSPWYQPCCRFTPSCSQYALEALQLHGVWKGSWLIIKRFSRCHPWGGYGYNPVPEYSSKHLKDK